MHLISTTPTTPHQRHVLAPPSVLQEEAESVSDTSRRQDTYSATGRTAGASGIRMTAPPIQTAPSTLHQAQSTLIAPGVLAAPAGKLRHALVTFHVRLSLLLPPPPCARPTRSRSNASPHTVCPRITQPGRSAPRFRRLWHELRFAACNPCRACCVMMRSDTGATRPCLHVR